MKKTSRTSLRHSNTSTSRVIDVSAGLVFRSGKLLIAQRHTDSHQGGLWEFPGGKRKPDETFEQCLARELREELGVDVSVGMMLDEVTHAYPEKTVRLKFFFCRLRKGEPRPMGCAAVKWVSPAELAHYEFPAADAKLLEKLSVTKKHWRQL